tara:strand:- start:1549 stop:1935 length:387 start_codon:yes stop_codon:yes gene_type:complete
MAIRRNLSQPLAVSAFDGPDKPKKGKKYTKTKKKIVRGGKKKKEVKEFEYRSETDDGYRREITSTEGTVKKKYDKFGRLKKKVTKTKTAPRGQYVDGKFSPVDPKSKKRRTVKKKTKVKGTRGPTYYK